MKIGYVIVSNKIMIEDESVGYFYREEPSDSHDSGWRFFSGTESEEYSENAENFAMYNAISLIDKEPRIKEFLGMDFPIEVEFDGSSYVIIDEEEE